MENKNLQAELDWVDKHPQFYIDDVHREDVKLNLTLGYEIRELESQLNTVAIHERAALELKIGDLKDSRRYNRKAEYVSIKCPPTPTTRPLLEICKVTEVRKYSLDDVVKSDLGDGKVFDAIAKAFTMEIIETADRAYLQQQAKPRNGKKRPRY